MPQPLTEKLVVLDRDGVINFDSDEHIKSEDEWRAIPGSLEAIARLNQHGYQIAIASNQSGISRGLLDIDTLNRIHQKMMRELAAHNGYIDAIFFCPHHPDDGCECRKPLPGLLKRIGERFQRDMSNVPYIGDRYRDLQAALAVGARPILVRTDKGQLTLQEHRADVINVPIFDNLAAAVDALLS